MMSDTDYKTYVLRVWQVERDAQMVVVASLEDPITNQRTAFPSLPALLAFLEHAANTAKTGIKPNGIERF